MTSDAPVSPDLELYLLKADTDRLQNWLVEQLGDMVTDNAGNGRFCWRHAATNMTVIYTEKAEKNFGCLWFKTNQTPWKNDLECARAIHAAMGVEVRCAASEWSEGTNDDEQPGWVKLIRGEEKPFDWL